MALEHKFRCLVVAPCASGKTYLLINKLLKKHFKQKFNRIWSIVPTIFQEQWQSVDLAKERTSDECTDEKFMEFFEKIKETHKKDPDITNLIIIDDCAFTPLLNRGSTLSTEILRLRHYNASIIILSQLYKAVQPAIRVNLTDLIVFRIDNKAEIKKIEEECDSFYGPYEAATSEQYRYVLVDFTKNILDPDRFLDTPF